MPKCVIVDGNLPCSGEERLVRILITLSVVLFLMQPPKLQLTKGTVPIRQTNWYKGKKVGEIWGYRASGLIQTQEEADEYNASYDLSYLSGQKWMPGDVKYINLDGNNKIDNGTNTIGDMGDMTVIGNTTPRYQYTIDGSISWKGLSLSLMFQGVGKRDWCPAMNTSYFLGIGCIYASYCFQRTPRLLDTGKSERLLSESVYRRQSGCRKISCKDFPEI